jgi:hypothetical protein
VTPGYGAGARSGEEGYFDLHRWRPKATAALAAALEASGRPANGAEALLAKARSIGAEPAYALR